MEGAAAAFGGKLNVLFNNVGTFITPTTVDVTQVRSPAKRWQQQDMQLACVGYTKAEDMFLLMPRALGTLQAEFQHLINSNLESAFALSQLAHPLLKASGDGVIIFNSSVAGGPTAMNTGSVYGLTKVGPRGWLCIHPAGALLG